MFVLRLSPQVWYTLFDFFWIIPRQYLDVLQLIDQIMAPQPKPQFCLGHHHSQCEAGLCMSWYPLYSFPYRRADLHLKISISSASKNETRNEDGFVEGGGPDGSAEGARLREIYWLVEGGQQEHWPWNWRHLHPF
jgi:hypothetical protein